MDQRDDWHITERVSHELGEGDPFAAAVRATRMPMVITDPRQADNPIIFCNAAFQALTEYARDEILGRNCRFLQGPDTDRAAVARLRQAVQAQTYIDIDLLNYRKDGSSFWNALYLSPVRNAEGDVQFFFASQLDVSERVEAQSRVERQKAEVEREVQRRTADLQAALEAKTLLLHEVDHRVKNNLTMIGSLLRLQARSIDDRAITSKLETMLERVDALAAVHRRLYQSDDITRFDMSAFAVNLVSDVIGASGRDDITLKADTTTIEVPSSSASALGLILNEVLTNAVKHGFRDGRSGTLQVATRLEDGQAELTVSDDGMGFPTDEEVTEGLGQVLINRLSRQVRAETRWAPANPGTRVTISFPIDATP